MEVVLFAIFSLMEYASILVLIFSLFRFNLNEYIPEVVFSSSLMTFFSYWIRYGSFLDVSAPFVQMGFLIIMMWVVFRFHLFWSTLMGGLVYAGYGILQAIILIGMEWIFGTGILVHDVWRHVLQVVTATAALLISWILHRYDKGLNFVPQGRVLTSTFSKANVSLLVSVLVILLTFSFSFYSLLKGHYSLSVSLVMLILTGFTLMSFFYLANRRMKRDD